MKKVTPRVGKLFAKHLKAAEQVDFLRTTLVDIAVGTPNRLAKIMEDFGGLCW